MWKQDLQAMLNIWPADRLIAEIKDVFYAETGVKLPDTQHPVYLSIDKDVISRDELVTNWDQGQLSIENILQFVRALVITEKKCFGRDMLAVDICGECAPDQEDCDLGKAISQNDSFNAEIIKLLS